VKHVADHWPRDFLILEPDAVPLKPGWLDDIAAAYSHVAGKFMGHIYSTDQLLRFMSGIAVYPADTAHRLPLHEFPLHWDVEFAGVMVSQGAHTPLINHFFGQRDLSPTFVEVKTPQSPINAFALDWIPKEVVLFHRNKNGTLMRLLKRKLFPHLATKQITVVFNVHRGDIRLALKHAQWLHKMGMESYHRAIVAHDVTCPIPQTNKLAQELRQCFLDVDFFVYPRPTGNYPQTANMAWQAVAKEMAKGEQPWLWWEADAIALKKDWLEQLQREYEREKKSWMGVRVPHMSHCNGLAIYPADAAFRMPKAMRATGEAWDMVAKDEINDMHDSKLFFHVWTLVNRNAHPVGGGEEPRGITADDLRRWLSKEAVILHRVKDDSVLNALISGEYTH